MDSHDYENLDIKSPIESESYISILQKENNSLIQNLKAQNEITNNLKLQVNDKEKEKSVLIKTIESQDIKINENNNLLNELKNKIYKLKEKKNNNNENKNKNNIIQLKKEKEELKKDNEIKEKKINELKEKILNVENEIKKQRESKITIEINQENIFNKEKDEIKEIRNNNILLQNQLDNILLEHKKILNEKNYLSIKIEQYKKQKEKKNIEINQKEENILNKKNESKTLLQEINIQKKYNIQLNSQIKLMSKKYKNMEENNKDLENVIIKQEEKINELSLKLNNIVKDIQKKNSEINKNKIYIIKLENTVKDLNKQYRLLKIQKPKESQNEMNYLKSQIAELKRELEKDKSMIRNKSLVSYNSYDRSLINNYKKYNHRYNFSRYNLYYIKRNYKGKLKNQSVSSRKIYNSYNKKNNLINKESKFKHKINNTSINNVLNVSEDINNLKLYHKPQNIINENNFRLLYNERSEFSEKKEKEKIQEIKILMQQLVNDVNTI